MANSLAIHILPDSNPNNVSEMIRQLNKDPDLHFDTAKVLIEYLRECGQSTNEWVQSTASSMGIVERSDTGLHLSQNGSALGKIRDDAIYDLMHFLMYTGWNDKKPSEFLQSWAYRSVCDQYWQMGHTELSSDYLDRQVAEIIDVAQSVFSEMNIGNFDEISFSRKSLRGAHNWLEAVNPPVIDGKIFKRRSFCPPELVMMALGYTLRDEDNIVGIDILLTQEKRELISKICLLEPDALDRALDWSMPIFSNLITPGTTAGFYGRFVRLSRIPSLEDMIR